jgi:hypothetical protein
MLKYTLTHYGQSVFEHVGSEVALWTKTKTKGASDEYAVLQVNTNSGSFVFRSKDDSIPVRCTAVPTSAATFVAPMFLSSQFLPEGPVTIL